MLDARDSSAASPDLVPAERIVADWLDRFHEGLAGGPAAVVEVFAEDCHWRDLVALTGELRTRSGAEAPLALANALGAARVTELTLSSARLAPRRIFRAGRDCIEARFTFETGDGPCEGLVRLIDDGPQPVAWSIMTALEKLHAMPGRKEPAYARDVRAPNWADHRAADAAYADRDPAVLVVGGGHSGLAFAARMKEHRIDTLVVDREERIGDNWRLRYHNLKLHNQIRANEMPYLPYPSTWPDYIPKDMIADWLESYTRILEINFWTSTNFEGATWNEDTQDWTARVNRAGDGLREMRVRHIVMAASASAVPRYPDIPTLDAFEGEKIHAAHFKVGSEWKDRPVMVLGTGTSAHDICQHLHAHGAQVTMVQRSPTMVVNVDPSAQIYDGLYLGEGIAMEDRDLVNVSIPLDLIKRAHQVVTEQVKEIDRETLDGLERAGFRLEYGEDNTGWPLKYRTRGGGYYFNVGCSELIIDHEIDLIQYHDIDAFVADGVRMKDGAHRPAELVVMATGYKTMGALLPDLFGDDVTARVGQVWGFDDRQEMASMWSRTGQPGLWFTAGAFSMARMYGRYLGLQIAIAERARAGM